MFQSLSPSAISRWSIAHRRRVIGGWLLLLVLVIVVAKGVGNSFDNGLALPKTDSQRAVELLQSRFPRVAGDAGLGAIGATPAGSPADFARAPALAPGLAFVGSLAGGIGLGRSTGGFPAGGAADLNRAAASSSTVLRFDLTSAPSSRRRTSTSATLRLSSLASCPTRIFPI